MVLLVQNRGRNLSFESKSLYRALLRAASYIPDSFARTYFHKYIVSRARVHDRKSNPASGFVRDQQVDIAGRSMIIKWLRHGRKDLSCLVKAGNGSPEHLTKVLLRAHGRQGSRKHLLIRELLKKDLQGLPANTAALATMIHDRKNHIVVSKFIRNPKFSAFLLSQYHNNRGRRKNLIRTLTPKIPTENIWGRPFPKKRTANLRKAWWAATLEKLLPPIPQKEWERLEGLATGRSPLEDSPSKRIPAREHIKKIDNVVAIQQLCRAVRAVDPRLLDSLYYSNEGIQQAKTQNFSFNDRQKPIEARVIRRLYGSIWALTATMSKDVNTGEWKVKWGLGKSPTECGQVTQPSIHDEELFRGLEIFPGAR